MMKIKTLWRFCGLLACLPLSIRSHPTVLADVAAKRSRPGSQGSTGVSSETPVMARWDIDMSNLTREDRQISIDLFKVGGHLLNKQQILDCFDDAIEVIRGLPQKDLASTTNPPGTEIIEPIDHWPVQILAHMKGIKYPTDVRWEDVTEVFTLGKSRFTSSALSAAVIITGKIRESPFMYITIASLLRVPYSSSNETSQEIETM